MCGRGLADERGFCGQPVELIGVAHREEDPADPSILEREAVGTACRALLLPAARQLTDSRAGDPVPAGPAVRRDRVLTVATSMQQRGAPSVAVNGNTDAIIDTLPNNNDSTIARQADRSGFPRTAVLSFSAGLLVAGGNEITLTHGPATAAGTGLGWDTFVLEVDEGTTAATARLLATASKTGSSDSRTWSVRVRNVGNGPAHDVRLSSVTNQGGQAVAVADRDPNRFPVPITGVLAPGESRRAPSNDPLNDNGPWWCD